MVASVAPSGRSGSHHVFSASIVNPVTRPQQNPSSAPRAVSRREASPASSGRNVGAMNSPSSVTIVLNNACWPSAAIHRPRHVVISPRINVAKRPMRSNCVSDAAGRNRR